MTISIPLDIGTDSSQRHGWISPADAIESSKSDINYITSTVTTGVSNSSRASGGFSNVYTSEDKEQIAKRMHLQKSELEFTGDEIGSADGPSYSLKLVAVRNAQRGLEAAVGRAGIDAAQAVLDNKIQALEDYKKTREEASEGDTYLIDDFTEGAGSDEEGADFAYNPDFPIETVTYLYTDAIKGATTNQSGSADVGSGPRSPINNGESYESLTAGSSSGGFGNYSNVGTVGDGVINSLRVTKRYKA
jgi:hypothetical protein